MSKTTNGFRNTQVLQSRGSKKENNTQTQALATKPSASAQSRKAARRKVDPSNSSDFVGRKQQPRPASSASKLKSSFQQKVANEVKPPRRNPFSGNTTRISKQSKRPVKGNSIRKNATKAVPLTNLEFKKISIG